ncbi:hypothetical protein [Bifidobacterium ramosum]|uniref:Uncharacterized protein n=1 Tax=Bifidobacterium ramosum TaxID=1798158 RepID=A0A7K3TC54_9BIFI|nr:hypothetical protein [Bifidobacterium ramosum]NEG72121.1 hypothetical protein [Bifidobacterium ramosum]
MGRNSIGSIRRVIAVSVNDAVMIGHGMAKQPDFPSHDQRCAHAMENGVYLPSHDRISCGKAATGWLCIEYMPSRD